MTNDDNDKITDAGQDDAQLSAYFEAHDGVSTTYHTLGDEVPSDELNTRILVAARVEVSDDPVVEEKKSFFNVGYYPMAASVLLTMFVVTVYVNNKPAELFENIPIEAIDAGEIESDNVVAEILFDLSAQPVESDLVAPVAPEAARARTGVVYEFREQQQRQQAEAPNVESFQADSVGISETEIEEMIVTGSRVGLAAVAPSQDNSLNYRNSIDEWLEEILFLLEEDVEAAELESELFMQVYPDVELTPTLNQLRNIQ